MIDGVLDYEGGAILRTISIDNSVLNSSDPDSAFLVTVEESPVSVYPFDDISMYWPAAREVVFSLATPEKTENDVVALWAKEVAKVSRLLELEKLELLKAFTNDKATPIEPTAPRTPKLDMPDEGLLSL